MFKKGYWNNKKCIVVNQSDRDYLVIYDILWKGLDTDIDESWYRRWIPKAEFKPRVKEKDLNQKYYELKENIAIDRDVLLENITDLQTYIQQTKQIVSSQAITIDDLEARTRQLSNTVTSNTTNIINLKAKKK